MKVKLLDAEHARYRAAKNDWAVNYINRTRNGVGTGLLSQDEQTVRRSSMFRCNHCGLKLIEIGRFGERLDCNRRAWRDVRECICLSLPDEDIWTLRAVVRRG